MDLLQSAALGLIQGVTEWLPISSTGHLRLAEYYFGLTVPLLFDVFLHFGTLIVILVFFRKDVLSILKALEKGDFKSEDGKMIPLIIVGTVPTFLIGFFLGDALDRNLNSIMALGVGFIVSGFAVYATKFGSETKQDISFVDALIIGTAQGLSIIPSVSRSGFTIVAALLLGIKRKQAFKFSFLLSVPSIIGALGLTLYQQQAELTLASIGLTEIAIGVIASILISFLALKLLWKTLATKKFYLFAFYCFAIGVLLLALSFGGI